MDKIEQIRELRRKGLTFEEAYEKVMKEEVCEGYKKLMKLMKGGKS